MEQKTYVEPSEAVKTIKYSTFKLVYNLIKDRRNIACKTWTTDVLFIETPYMIKYRREEGWQVVEMECATMAAIAQTYNFSYSSIYSRNIQPYFNIAKG